MCFLRTLFKSRRSTASLRWLFVILGIALATPVAARPTAMRIFPKETLAFLRIAHAREAFEKMRASTGGRLFDDPELRPFLDHLYQSAESMYTESLEEGVGMSLNEFWEIPQGEIAAGLIARENNKPTFAFLIELGDESTAAHKLLDRILDQMTEEGVAREVETINDLEVTVMRIDDDYIDAVVFIERENTLIVAADAALARQMLALWDAAESGEPIVVEEAENADDEDGEKAKNDSEPIWTKSLAENQQFVSVMRYCRTPGDDPPDSIGFADPIEIFRNFARGEAALSIAVATLKPLGLDGIRAVGYSTTIGTENYDDLTHMHLLLDNPRAGVLALFNFRSGDVTPEPWVFDDVENYITGYLDVPLTYDKLIAIYDQFQYKGAFEKLVAENINENTGLDFQKDVIDQFAGRFTLLTGFQRPAGLRPRATVFAAKVRDEDAARATIEKLVAIEPDEFEERTFGKAKFWVVADAIDDETPEDESIASPCFGVYDGYAFFSVTIQSFEDMVAAQDGTRGRLLDSDDYLEVMKHVERQTSEPVGLLISRPEESVRYVYELATSDKVRESIAEMADSNPVMGALDRALTEAPLPPFESLAKYFAPSGGVVTDTEAGFHFVTFTVKGD